MMLQLKMKCMNNAFQAIETMCEFWCSLAIREWEAEQGPCLREKRRVSKAGRVCACWFLCSSLCFSTTDGCLF